MNEAAQASPLGTTLFDSMLGLAIRRHCAPVLDLDPLAAADDYLARRGELGAAEVNRRFLAAAGIDTYLVDTGLGDIGAGVISSPDELAAIAGGNAREVVRLEHVAEQVLRAGTSDFAGAVTDRLRSAKAAGAVGAKSIAAYRVGLGLPADKPGAAELDRALAGAEPAAPSASMPVSAWLAHTALEVGLPLQLHVGYGDSDLDLLDCDPLRLTAFLRATEERGVPVLLLHNYPYHRNAAYLAQVFDHVFLDLGLATHNTGALSRDALPRDARARALRQAALLHRRLRAGRALPARHAALPVRPRAASSTTRRRRRHDRHRRGVRRPPRRRRQRPPVYGL